MIVIKNICLFIWLILVVLVINPTINAAELDLDFSEIKLISTHNFLKSSFFIDDTEDKVNIQGMYKINIQNITDEKYLYLDFQADDPETYLFMAENLQLQYYLSWASEDGGWSDWLSLKQLPQTIQLNKSKNLQPTTGVIFIRFSVPKSLVKRGIHQGRFDLRIY